MAEKFVNVSKAVEETVKKIEEPLPPLIKLFSPVGFVDPAGFTMGANETKEVEALTSAMVRAMQAGTLQIV